MFDGVMEEGVAEAALIDYEHVEAGALRVDGAGEAGRACSDDENVVGGVAHRAIVWMLGAMDRSCRKGTKSYSMIRATTS